MSTSRSTSHLRCRPLWGGPAREWWRAHPPFSTLALVVKKLREATVLVLVLAAAVACAGPAQQASPSPAAPVSLEYDRSAGVLVVEADTAGGLAPPPTGRHVPEVSIYGDGLVVIAAEGDGPVVGTDRVVTVGHLEEEEVGQLLALIADSGFFGLQDRYMASPAAPDLPWRQVTINLKEGSKTVSIYPFDYADAPTAFREAYDAVVRVQPSEKTPFTATSGTLTATDLGPIDELPGGQANQVAPWDTPLVGIALSAAIGGVPLEGEGYRIVEEFLLRYPQGQLFGSQEGRAYQALLEADLPWEEESA
jgi:hypothetical protein